MTQRVACPPGPKPAVRWTKKNPPEFYHFLRLCKIGTWVAVLLPLMGRRLRYFPPDSLVEVTTRTLQSRFLLPPTKAFASTVVGILARARKRAPIRIHAVGGLSSHIHIPATVDDAEQLADFMEYANGNIAREALRLVQRRGWSGKLWGRRYAAIPVSEEEAAQVRRLRYLISQGYASYCTSWVIWGIAPVWRGRASAHGVPPEPA